MTELESGSCESSFFLGSDLGLCLWPVYSSFSRNTLNQFSKNPLLLISYYPGLPEILLSQFSKDCTSYYFPTHGTLLPNYLAINLHFSLYSELSLLSLPATKLYYSSPLNKVFLAIFNKCHKYV